jgi:hypothetical protein
MGMIWIVWGRNGMQCFLSSVNLRTMNLNTYGTVSNPSCCLHQVIIGEHINGDTIHKNCNAGVTFLLVKN